MTDQQDKMGKNPDVNEAVDQSAASVATSAEPEMVTVRVKKRVRKGRRSGGKKGLRGPKKTLVVVLGVILGLILAAGIALAVAVNMGNVNLHGVFNWNPSGTAVETEDEGHTIEYKGDTYRYNENIISVLVMGLDEQSLAESGGRAGVHCNDANLLVCMDTDTDDITVIAIPRDSQVDVDLYKNGEFAVTKPLQLCLAYSTDCGSAKKCARNAMKSVSNVFYGMPVNYYLSMELAAVGKASSVVGGVKVKALDYVPGLCSKGDQLVLQGNNALRYVQYRNCDIDLSALGRLNRQKQFVNAFAGKLRGMSAKGILDVYNSVKGYTHTNLGVAEMSYLASCLAKGGTGNFKMITLKGKTKLLKDDDGIMREHVFLKKSSVMNAITKTFYKKVEARSAS